MQHGQSGRNGDQHARGGGAEHQIALRHLAKDAGHQRPGGGQRREDARIIAPALHGSAEAGLEDLGDVSKRAGSQGHAVKFASAVFKADGFPGPVAVVEVGAHPDGGAKDGGHPNRQRSAPQKPGGDENAEQQDEAADAGKLAVAGPAAEDEEGDGDDAGEEAGAEDQEGGEGDGRARFLSPLHVLRERVTLRVQF